MSRELYPGSEATNSSESSLRNHEWRERHEIAETKGNPQVANLLHGSSAMRRGDHFGGEAGDVVQSLIGRGLAFADRGDVAHDRRADDHAVGQAP